MEFSNDPVVKLHKACIFQGITVILQDVTFNIDKGEFVFLIGKTGSGKSSLLKTLYADLPLKMGEGEVTRYNLTDIKTRDIPYLRRKLGIVFQDFQLFTDRTVAENLYFVMRATGWKERS